MFWLNDFLNNKRILVVGAHTDDIELGCGATVARAVRRGCHVSYLIFSIARASVPMGFPEDALAKEALQAATHMGVKHEDCKIYDLPVREMPSHRQAILEALVQVRDSNWDMILFPSPNDVHQDHSTVGRECLRAFKGNPLLMSYMLPWNQIEGGEESNTFVSVSEEDLTRKIEALGCYKTQFAKGRGYMEPDFIRAWARLRGAQAGLQYAEAFRVWRWRI